MKIKYWMTKEPITVTPDTLAIDAQKIMKENKIRRLPVVEKGKLVGIVTFRNLIEAAPSSATSLSIFELNYLIMRMKVKDLMKKNVITISPEDTVVDAISLGMKHDIGGFPVLDHGELVGIVTETQISRAMMRLFGTNVKEEIDSYRKCGSSGRNLWKNRGDSRKIGSNDHQYVFCPQKDHGPDAGLSPNQTGQQR